MAASDNLHPQLFGTEHLEAKRDYTPEKWMQNVTYHSSNKDRLPQEGEHGGGSNNPNAYGTGFHTGTLQAAEIAAQYGEGDLDDDRKWIHPVRTEGQHLLAPSNRRTKDSPVRSIASDDLANDDYQEAPQDWREAGIPSSEEAIKQGLNVPYNLGLEDRGTVAIRSPRENIKTWGEDVMSDPNAPSRYRAQAEAGVDLMINRRRPPQVFHQQTLGGGEEAVHSGIEHAPAHPYDEEDLARGSGVLAKVQFRVKRD